MFVKCNISSSGTQLDIVGRLANSIAYWRTRPRNSSHSICRSTETAAVFMHCCSLLMSLHAAADGASRTSSIIVVELWTDVLGVHTAVACTVHTSVPGGFDERQLGSGSAGQPVLGGPLPSCVCTTLTRTISVSFRHPPDCCLGVYLFGLEMISTNQSEIEH